MENSNEKSKECCPKCYKSNVFGVKARFKCEDCKCHKPSVENCQKCDSYICKCEVRPFEPQSIPLDRDEGKERDLVMRLRCEICGAKSDNDHDEDIHRDSKHKFLHTHNLTPESEQKCGKETFLARHYEFQKDGICQKCTPESNEMEEWESRFDDLWGGWNGAPEGSSNGLDYYIKQLIRDILGSHSQKLVSEFKEKITKEVEDLVPYKTKDGYEICKKHTINIINNS
jgi:hypothetical protein